MSLVSELRYRPNPRASGDFGLHPALLSNNISIAESVLILLSCIEGYVVEENEPEGESEASLATARLRTVLPEQNVSPLRFDIVNGRLVIARQPPSAQGLDAEVAQSARDELVDRGEKLIEQLGRSNCDPRLLENVTELQHQLTSDSDIVRLGIANLGCTMLCGAYEQELPDAIGAMLRSQTIGISMYVAQFPEWQRFSDNAANIDLNADLIRTVHDTANQLVVKLEQNSSLADPEIPRVIALLNMLINDPAAATKRAAFAVLRTIENLVIRVYQYCADFVDDTIRKSSTALATTTSKVVVAGVLSIALASAVNLAPVATQVEGSAWITKATEIVSKQLREILGDR